MKDGIAAVGDVLAGKYRVDKILGIGGMGMVVAATHLELDQRVALKFMLPGAAESPDTAQRFLREARAAGRLNSDHVCRMVDLGRFDSGAPYIVMEYLQGESLAALLRRRGPLRVSEAVDYILQAIEGLAEAHAHGIVHRDLKPDNLFLHRRNDGGTILKVLDFGISKISLHGVSTRTGDIMGSPAYMAPEQMESTRSVDQRADVWSLGVVLYQLVVGEAPFHGETLPLLCMNVVNDEPPAMSATRGDLPDGFEAAAMKCLQKEPAARYADVGELARALAPFGPQHASTSASRIQIVLQRTGKHDSAQLIESGPAASDAGAAAGPALESERLPPNTLVATSGQSHGARGDGRSWGVAGAIVAGLGFGALVLVMLWRTGVFGEPELAMPPAVARPSPPVAAPARPPAPIVEPIVEPIAEPPKAPAAASAVAAPAVDPSAPGGAAGSPATAAPAESGAAATVRATPPPERKRKRPPPRSRPPRAGAAAESAAGSGSGSAASEDDDKWMHMTHDAKKP